MQACLNRRARSREKSSTTIDRRVVPMRDRILQISILISLSFLNAGCPVCTILPSLVGEWVFPGNDTFRIILFEDGSYIDQVVHGTQQDVDPWRGTWEACFRRGTDGSIGVLKLQALQFCFGTDGESCSDVREDPSEGEYRLIDSQHLEVNDTIFERLAEWTVGGLYNGDRHCRLTARGPFRAAIWTTFTNHVKWHSQFL